MRYCVSQYDGTRKRFRTSRIKTLSKYIKIILKKNHKNKRILFSLFFSKSGGQNKIIFYQHSLLSSSTNCCVSLPVSLLEGFSSRGRICNLGDDVLCVILLGAKIAETGSIKGPAVVPFLLFVLDTSAGTS